MSNSTSSVPLHHVTLPTPGTPRHLDRLRYFAAGADAGGAGVGSDPGADGGQGGDEGGDGEQTKPTETVEFWKQKAREQEKRAKDNAAAAKRLGELEDAQKTDAQRAADALAEATTRAEKAEREKTALSIAVEHKLDAGDAELVAGMPDEDSMRALAQRLADAADAQSKKGPVTKKSGASTTPPKPDEDREFVRALFGRSE